MSLFTQLLNSLRYEGARATLAKIRYAVQRDAADKQFAAPPSQQPVSKPGALAGVTTYSDEARFDFGKHRLEIRFLAENLARLTWQPGTLPIPYAIANDQWAEIKINARENANGWDLNSARLHITLKRDGSLEFRDSQNKVLRRENPPEFSGTTSLHTAQPLPDERVYGLGERAAPLNRRGRAYSMWNTDPGGSYGPGNDPLYTCIPVYLSLNPNGAYLIFYENAFEATFDFSKDLFSAHFQGGALRYYFITGTPQEILQRYTELTGRHNLPPRWALGYHQSRWGYKTESEIRAIADEFENRDLPLHAIHLDIDYMDGYRLFTVDKKRFPNLPGLANDLQQRGIRLVSILDCGVKIDPQYSVYRQGKEADAYCKYPNGSPVTALVWPGECVFPDFTASRARDWWAEQYPRLLDAGIAGIWHDMNEPAAFTLWGENTLPRSTRHAFEGRTGRHVEGHNLYGFLMNRAGYEALQHLRPNRRPWLLSRSGWAGMQRYAWNWTGDIASTWDVLRQTIPTILGLTLSGVYYSGSDIGGFSGHPSPELYARWFQLAAFTPFFRLHCATGLPYREPWHFDKTTQNIVRGLLKLRTRLLPYWYTLAWDAAQNGNPLMRPLWWQDPTNRDFWDLDDAFLLGEHLLVAPILEEGKRERNVLLPPGDWYNFWDDRVLLGPGPERLAAPLERIPLFVRGGTLLPLEESGKLQWHLYAPQSDGTFINRLYSDAGDGYEAHRLDTLTVTRSANVLTIDWQTEGAYPWQYGEFEIHLHGLRTHNATIDGRTAALQETILRCAPFEHLRFEP